MQGSPLKPGEASQAQAMTTGMILNKRIVARKKLEKIYAMRTNYVRETSQMIFYLSYIDKYKYYTDYIIYICTQRCFSSAPLVV